MNKIGIFVLLCLAALLFTGCTQTSVQPTPTPSASPTAIASPSPTPGVPGFSVKTTPIVCQRSIEPWLHFSNSTNFEMALQLPYAGCYKEYVVDSVTESVEDGQMEIALKRFGPCIQVVGPGCGVSVGSIGIKGTIRNLTEAVKLRVFLDGNRAVSFFLTGPPSPDVPIFSVETTQARGRYNASATISFSTQTEFAIKTIIPSGDICKKFAIDAVEVGRDCLEVICPTIMKIKLKNVYEGGCIALPGALDVTIHGVIDKPVGVFKVFTDDEEVAHLSPQGAFCGGEEALACPSGYECELEVPASYPNGECVLKGLI